ncbi:signal peptidase complex subunit 1 [Cryptomeria japonica]|uniref:signal peptidase complex subunit 1 n=1 Tax=Cryptomeria japonica TaxID=3369 RepID=UPI0025AC89AA|nr:signal peptidase complex subunit 1 [Cryptomeria japonica]
MDWQGQKQSEILMQIMLVVSAVAAFVTGYVMSSFKNMLLIYAAGVVLTLLTTVPDWPLFNRHPLQWLDPKEAEIHGVRVQKPSKSQPQISSKKPPKASKK